MAFFDSFTDSIKQKWLQFFQINRDWIILQMAIESVYTPDGGKRPSSYLILGVVNALEPKLAQLMFPFAKLNPDADTLIEVLGLHFDPDIVLGNRLSPMQEPEIDEYISEVTEDISEDQPSVNVDFALNPEADAVQSFTVDVNEEWGESDSKETENGLDTFSLAEESNLEKVDEFSSMSFESISLTEDSPVPTLGDFNLSDENGLDDLNQPDDSEFRDVISDVWGDDPVTQEGEELPSEVFDESEMARLFPNN